MNSSQNNGSTEENIASSPALYTQAKARENATDEAKG